MSKRHSRQLVFKSANFWLDLWSACRFCQTQNLYAKAVCKRARKTFCLHKYHKRSDKTLHKRVETCDAWGDLETFDERLQPWGLFDIVLWSRQIKFEFNSIHAMQIPCFTKQACQNVCKLQPSRLLDIQTEPVACLIGQRKEKLTKLKIFRHKRAPTAFAETIRSNFQRPQVFDFSGPIRFRIFKRIFKKSESNDCESH